MEESPKYTQSKTPVIVIIVLAIAMCACVSIVGAGFTLKLFLERNTRQIDHVTPLATEQPKPPIQTEYEETFAKLFPTSDATFKTFESSFTFTIASDKTNFAYPRSYHSLLVFCQKVSRSPSVSILMDEDSSYPYSCALVSDRLSNTGGSTSYALWYLSYRNSQEIDLINELIAQRNIGNYTEAISTGNKLLALNRSAPNLYDVGFIYYLKAGQRDKNEMANLKQAENYYKAAIKADPNFAPPYASLPYVQQLQMKPMRYTSSMDKNYEKAKKLDKKWSFAWMNKGESLALAGRFTEAYTQERTAVTINPDFPDHARVVRNFICISNYTGKRESDSFYSKYGITKQMLKSGC